LGKSPLVSSCIKKSASPKEMEICGLALVLLKRFYKAEARGKKLP
jgi:hypothetical protein